MLKLVTALILLIASSYSQAQNLEQITFRAFDADSGDEVPAAFSVDGRALDQGLFALNRNQESTIAIEVKTEAGKGYYSRTFNLFLAGYSGRQLVMHVYLARRGQGAVYSLGSVSQAATHLGSTPDRVVALLERVRSETPSHLFSTQFGVRLRFNLARGYFQNCTRRGIDSCDIAASVFDDLRREMKADSSHFMRERIDENALRTADFDRQRLVNVYRRGKWDFRRGAFESAVEAFQALLSEADSGKDDVFTQLQVSRVQVEADLRLARLRSESTDEK